jgi:phosphatidylserine/phosphatidylglycerophosphate/cardiolipin synthase-like enzyme
VINLNKKKIQLVSHLSNQHYDQVILGGIKTAEKSVLIATANVKNVMVKRLKRYFSIIETLARLCQRGVDIKFLHAQKPSQPFLDAIHKHPELEQEHFDMRLCARNHMKMVSIDNKSLYLGSANFTGAGIGLRAKERHNFELGIITLDKNMVKDASDLFYDIWTGRMCKKCSFRKNVCKLPLDRIE